ncbi:MAG TPA: ABC transporter substrate-binding protein [Bacteroidia bacterium]|nr:ABC transporter substrate-binding protein [Bacteroidia bacterium]
MHKKLMPLLSVLSGAIAFFLWSCSGNNNSSETIHNDSIHISKAKFIDFKDADKFLPSWSTDNTLVYHVISQPNELHPTNGISADRYEIHQYTQVYLINIDYRNLTLKPAAVESLPTVSEDGMSYTYKLREDITFDDGSPISLDDVLFTFKANKCPLTNNPGTKPFLDNLLDIQVDKTNPREFTMIMKEKYIHNIDFLEDYPLMQRTFFDKNNVMAHYTFAQFNDKSFKADERKELNDWATEFNSSKYGRDPKFLVGAGPYQVEKWEPGASITLVRKPHHWSEKSSKPLIHAYPQKIIFKLNKDENSQILEFKSQTLDASTYLTTKTLVELQQDPVFNENYNSCFTNTYNFWFVVMNTRPDGVVNKKLFTDKRVRRAMAMLTPVNQINKIVNNNRNTRMVGPVSPLKPEYNTDLKLIGLDIEGAKKLLDEAGWKDTDGDNIRDKMVDGEKIKMEFNLNYMTSTVDWKNTAQLMAEQMYKAGVKAIPNPVEFSVNYAMARNHNFDMMLAANSGTYTSEDYTQNWHTTSWLSKGSNYSGFGNAASDALIDSIKYTLDDEKRNRMAKRLQAILYDEQPCIFLFSSLRRNVIHKRFGNQEVYFERPGITLSNLKLLSPDASKNTQTP